MISKSDPIIIVGGGTFGLSSALHLSQSGYRNISVFEQDPEIPSRYSAANDLNKIVRAEYEDPFYTDLTMVCSLHSSLSAPDSLTIYRKPYQRGNRPCLLRISTRPASCIVSREKPPREQFPPCSVFEPQRTAILTSNHTCLP